MDGSENGSLHVCTSRLCAHAQYVIGRHVHVHVTYIYVLAKHKDSERYVPIEDLRGGSHIRHMMHRGRQHCGVRVVLRLHVLGSGV